MCPVCGAGVKPVLIDKYMEFSINRCPACDVVYSDPMKSPGADWYEKSELYSVGKVLNSELGWHHKQFIDGGALYGKRLLDVGCGPGLFLSEARKKGYEVWGLDFDKGNIRLAKERYGLENIFVKSIEDLSRDFSKKKFDVITFFEVLEHLEDPSKFMSQVKEMLNKDGYIALSVPNRERALNTLKEWDNPPHHLTKWSAVSLSAFLERNGFEVVKTSAKRLGPDEAVNFLKARIRFGISKKLAQRGVAASDEKDIRKAAMLLKGKNMVFDIFKILFLPLYLLPMQGTGLYSLARLKK